MATENSEHWDNVYQSLAQDEVSWYQPNPDQSLQLIERLSLTKEASIIDVGGGTSTLADALLSEGYTRISVLDISSQALKQSKHRLGVSASHVDWIHSDIEGFEPQSKYKLWHDRALFHFLTSEQAQENYLHTLHRTVESGGYVIIATFGVGGPEKCSGLPIVQYSKESMQSRLGREFKYLFDVQESHTTPSGSNQLFHYFCFQFAPN